MEASSRWVGITCTGGPNGIVFANHSVPGGHAPHPQATVVGILECFGQQWFGQGDGFAGIFHRLESLGSLGDIIIPGTLVVSAFTFLDGSGGVLGIPANLCVAIFTITGILVGFTFLMKTVLSGKPQAGLPLLNTGAIFGYVVGYLIFFQDLTLGFQTPLFGFGF